MGIHSLIQNLTIKDPVPSEVNVSSFGRKEIFQNRFNHGPNIGAMFVAEKWIDNSIFPENAQGDAELSAVEALVKDSNQDDVRKKFEDRWNNFMTDQDWQYLQEKGVTAVRLPIGYWNAGAKFTKNTPFEQYSKVYAGSWDIIKSVIEKADSYDIGVLLDFHAVPGGANGDAHSGTNSNKAEFWGSSHYRDLALEMYKFAVQDLASIENLVGIQLINEAPWGESKMKPFYLDAIKQIRKVNSTIPIMISDGWDLDGWQKTIIQLDQQVSKKNQPATIGVVIDTHVYRAFSDDDKKCSAQELVDKAKRSIPREDACDVMVGEYSCVLSEDSWSKCGNRDELEKQYGIDQAKCFEECARAGAYFWTYKFMQGPGGGWDFRCMVDKGAIPSYTRSVDTNKPNLDDSLRQALDAHKNYWSQQGANAHEGAFEAGYKQGFEDSKKFAELNGSEIGRLTAWRTARCAQYIKDHGDGDGDWAYAQAFTQAADAFKNAL